MRILVVEDDDDLAEMLVHGLSEEEFEVDRMADGADGLRSALDQTYDCVLLDVMLPSLDGIALCRRLRDKNKYMPVIMLTVRDQIQDRIEGLQAGADDYVVKPFSFEELLARIRAQIRRMEVFATADKNCGDLTLDPHHLTVSRAGHKVLLTPKEYQLLEYFVQRAGEILTERDVIENVWGMSFDPQTNIFNVYLHRLRKKLEVGDRKMPIETIRGRGYRLEVS